MIHLFAVFILCPGGFALLRILIRAGTAPVKLITGATLVSFVFFAVVSMAVFHARKAPRGWCWLLLPRRLAVIVLPAG